MSRRVVVTGLGMVTPLGLDATSTWEGLVAGRSGTALITQFDTEGFGSRVAAEVKDFDPNAFMERKESATRRPLRAVHLRRRRRGAPPVGTSRCPRTMGAM